jgi:MFS family permease
MAIGTISGALLAAGRRKPRFRSLFIGAAVFGVGCTFAALSPGYWWFAGSLVVIGVAALTLTNTSNSMMQLSAEPAMRGRVMALRLAVALGGTPIGAPIVGWVANHFGPRWALGVGAASGFAAAIVAIRVLTQATRSMPENELRPI